jgi:hypothetical protein
MKIPPAIGRCIITNITVLTNDKCELFTDKVILPVEFEALFPWLQNKEKK